MLVTACGVAIARGAGADADRPEQHHWPRLLFAYLPARVWLAGNPDSRPGLHDRAAHQSLGCLDRHELRQHRRRQPCEQKCCPL